MQALRKCIFQVLAKIFFKLAIFRLITAKEEWPYLNSPRFYPKDTLFGVENFTKASVLKATNTRQDCIHFYQQCIQ